ncbi:hypothetical protein [Natronolimnohabitans innermongolicus]|uniref:Uncharacterized protein n=1 Tax=Natronolimnohabitans innermongolicus JCM 12255 TaxID=1227499 RepID=L9WTH8_9EURY|nr:hypothetical protein [Natronolimnohabitans innermongolicus]ELY52784.1 hypothetical protein C493_15473 [Natronolimnohabitans innermongolicus JCM 12255]
MVSSRLEQTLARADEELSLSWAVVAAVIGVLAVRLLLDGTASLEELLRLVGYTAAVVALAVDRVRQWSGTWFLWALLCVHFATLFGGLVSVALLVAAGGLAIVGVQHWRGELEL